MPRVEPARGQHAERVRILAKSALKGTRRDARWYKADDWNRREMGYKNCEWDSIYSSRCSALELGECSALEK